MTYKRILVLPTVLLLVLSFLVVCAQPPPPKIPTAVPTRAPTATRTLPPRPTQTISQKETVIAQRSAEIFAKQTASAQLRSPAPSPTPTLSPTIAPRSSSLGVSRMEFRSIYEEDAGIICTGGLPVGGYGRGYETWICDAPLSSPVDMKLELVGPLWDDEVVYARLTIYDPDDHDQASALHTLLFLQSAAPDWSDGLQWVNESMHDGCAGRQPSKCDPRRHGRDYAVGSRVKTGVYH